MAPDNRGDTGGLSQTGDTADESVEGSATLGQFYGAEVLQGVEDARKVSTGPWCPIRWYRAGLIARAGEREAANTWPKRQPIPWSNGGFRPSSRTMWAVPFAS